MALLNVADAIFLGSDVVDRVYLGEELVWPAVLGVIYLSRNYVYEDAAAAALVGNLTTVGGTEPYTYTLVES